MHCSMKATGRVLSELICLSYQTWRHSAHISFSGGSYYQGFLVAEESLFTILPRISAERVRIKRCWRAKELAVRDGKRPSVQAWLLYFARGGLHSDVCDLVWSEDYIMGDCLLSLTNVQRYQITEFKMTFKRSKYTVVANV